MTLALSDTAISTVSNLGHVAEAQINREQRARLGNDLYGALGRDFPTSDGERVMVVAISDKQWSGLLEATESADAIAGLEQSLEVDFFDEGQRFDHRDLICDKLARWISSHPLTEVAARFDRHRVCWGRYQSFIDLVDDDPRCSEQNPMMQTITHSRIGKHLAAGSPLSFSKVDRRAMTTAPVLGQHTEEVLVELLGLSSAEIADLHDSGVVASA